MPSGPYTAAMPKDFGGLRIASFESRRAGDMASLVERQGGVAVSAPSMREAPIEDNPEALAFADRLLAGAFDVVILLTGVGTKMLAQAVATRHPVEVFTAALAKTIIVARGPKPVTALRELGLKPTLTVPEPNTWRDILRTLDAHQPVVGKRIAVQEYGVSNSELLDCLRQRGAAEVLPVPVYQWRLPEDLGPLLEAIDEIIAGRIDAVVFTSATQIHHVFQVAEQDGRTGALREAMKRVCIASVGPICSEAIRALGLAVDFEPDAPHMPHLVKGLARSIHDLLEKKRVAVEQRIDTNVWKRVEMRWISSKKNIADSVFMKACRREPVPYTPIWLMRQAGRYQRAYRDIRAGVSILELCKTPELAAEVTLHAVDQLGVDAAIIFADILLVAEPLGLKLEFVKGDGPVIENPVRTRQDVDRLKSPDVNELGYVFDAIRLTRKALRPDIALLGFCGAPFTIASYFIEGGKSTHYQFTKTLMFSDPGAWNALMARLVDLLIDYLNGQIAAGADAVQVFDSWVGVLSPDDYRAGVLPHMQRLFAGIRPGVPAIHFGTGNPALLPLMKEAGGSVMGLDWRVDLAEAWRTLGYDTPVMGNLDPLALYCTPGEIRRRAKLILDKAAGRPGHIFNLGHGILPTMSPEDVVTLVDAVHELSAR